MQLVPRQAFGHKGSYGHVLVIGGHAQMGGAVMLSAEAAFHAGAGKVTVVCDAKHHTAILSRAPNIMLRDINQMSLQEREALVAHVDAVSFGMGLGRNSWAQQQFDAWFPLIQTSALQVVLDADALWFLAEKPVKLGESRCTQHRILGRPRLCSVSVPQWWSPTVLQLFMPYKKNMQDNGCLRVREA